MKQTGMIALLMALLLGTTSLYSAPPIPTAPVSTEFATAKTIFLANAGGNIVPYKGTDDAEDSYSALYQQLKTWNHYQLVDTPAKADLSLELSIQALSSYETTVGVSAYYLQCVVRDTRTHALLWTINQPIKNAFRTATAETNMQDAVRRTVQSLKALTVGHQPDPKLNDSN